MENEKSAYLKGNIGLNAVRYFDNANETKKMAVFQIATGSKENVKWEDIKVWGKDAEKIKDLQKGTKVTLVGNFKEESYKNKTGEQITKNFFVAKETVQIHEKLADKEYTIGFVEEKKTGTGKEYTEVTAYDKANNDQSNFIKIYHEPNKIDSTLKSGNVIKIVEGDLRPYTYEKDKKIINAGEIIAFKYNSIQKEKEKAIETPKEKENKVATEEDKTAKAEKTTAAKAENKTAKTEPKKSKPADLSM